MKELVIATRGSKLALWQSEHIKTRLEEKYPDLSVRLNVMKTKGDKILDTPLAKIGGKGLFTKELEESMLKGESHLAVHSLKDVPVEFPKGLVLACVTKREDRRDCMLSQKYKSLNELPKGSVVGTTSLRRRMQILNLRDDLVIKNLRGNVNTRISKLKNGDYDAIILAMAGLNRLGLQSEVNFAFGLDDMIPAMGQAILGIECVDEPKIKEKIAFLQDDKALVESTVERDFVRVLEGGCQVPIGVSATLDGENIYVKAIVGMPDASKILFEQTECKKSEYQKIGKILASEMIQKGAKEILNNAQDMAMNVIFE